MADTTGALISSCVIPPFYFISLIVFHKKPQVLSKTEPRSWTLEALIPRGQPTWGGQDPSPPSREHPSVGQWMCGVPPPPHLPSFTPSAPPSSADPALLPPPAWGAARVRGLTLFQKDPSEWGRVAAVGEKGDARVSCALGWGGRHRDGGGGSTSMHRQQQPPPHEHHEHRSPPRLLMGGTKTPPAPLQ